PAGPTNPNIGWLLFNSPALIFSSTCQFTDRYLVNLENYPDCPHKVGASVAQTMGGRGLEDDAIARLKCVGFEPQFNRQFALKDEPELPPAVMRHIHARCRAGRIIDFEKLSIFFGERRQTRPRHAAV